MKLSSFILHDQNIIIDLESKSGGIVTHSMPFDYFIDYAKDLWNEKQESPWYFDEGEFHFSEMIAFEMVTEFYLLQCLAFYRTKQAIVYLSKKRLEQPLKLVQDIQNLFI